MSETADADPTHINAKGLETYLGHFPAGTSFQCINHFRQLVSSKRFQKYDYEYKKNL